MAADFIIRQGDTAPPLVWQLTDQTGAVIDLTLATSVEFVMRSLITSSPTVITSSVTVTTAEEGLVTYTWAAADTSIAGLYSGEFRITYSNGTIQTAPGDGYVDIWVEENLEGSAQFLVSLSDIKDHLNIPSTDRTHDQKLLRWVQAVRPVIENITGPIIVQSYDNFYDGGTMAIRVRYRPIVTLEAVSIYLGPVEYPMSIIPNPQLGSIWSVMADGNRIVRRGPGGSQLPFPSGYQNIHVIYQAGFVSVPENVRQATLTVLQDNWNPSQQPGPGHPGLAVDMIPVTPPGNFLVSAAAREWLVPNRRAPSVY